MTFDSEGGCGERIRIPLGGELSGVFRPYIRTGLPDADLLCWEQVRSPERGRDPRDWMVARHSVIRNSGFPDLRVG